VAASIDPCLAVIPARGGSKGLPGKNIRDLAGLPLIVHSLRCAERVPRLARTIVSTDSEEIADVVRAAGGDVPFMRPPELATDVTPTIPVLVHALDAIERAEGRTFETLLLLEPTSPGRIPDDIGRALAILDADPDADGVIACSQPAFNPFYVGVVERDGYLTPAFEGHARARRQDVQPFHRINGAVFLWRTSFIRRAPAEWVTAGRHRMLEIPEERAFSIDDAQELALADLMLRNGLVELPWLSITK
jgi:N-acylneuraminate cytidylyltransferase